MSCLEMAWLAPPCAAALRSQKSAWVLSFGTPSLRVKAVKCHFGAGKVLIGGFPKPKHRLGEVVRQETTLTISAADQVCRLDITLISRFTPPRDSLLGIGCQAGFDTAPVQATEKDLGPWVVLFRRVTRPFDSQWDIARQSAGTHVVHTPELSFRSRMALLCCLRNQMPTCAGSTATPVPIL
jgi:hypothetical protein